MQSSFRKGRQLIERAFSKRLDPMIHQTQIASEIITSSSASKSSNTDKSNDIEAGLSSIVHLDNRMLSGEKGSPGWQMQRTLAKEFVGQSKEFLAFDKSSSREVSRNSLKYPANWKSLNKGADEKYSTFITGKVKNNGELDESLTHQTHETFPIILPLRFKSPNITWGRAHTQNAAFADPNLVNVTARDGEQARLPCTVLRLEQGKVSWIRKRDLHILTVGRATYTSDQRFRVLHGEGSLDWTLIIGPTTLRDAGTYECQVSTKTKISRPVNLIIAVERAEIQGPKEVYIRNGSTISLTCIVKSKSEDLGSVLWTKEGVTLDYDSPRGGISLEVEKTPTKATTKLFITKARKPDSGTYICSPQFAQPASVIVHVVNGEESRAVQTSNSVELKSCIIALSISLLLSIKSLHLQLSSSQLSREYVHILFSLALITLLTRCQNVSILIHNLGMFIIFFIYLLTKNVKLIIPLPVFCFLNFEFVEFNYLNRHNEKADQMPERLNLLVLCSAFMCGLEFCIQLCCVSREITRRDFAVQSKGVILNSPACSVSKTLIKKITSEKR